jgi:hypothetical protein
MFHGGGSPFGIPAALAAQHTDRTAMTPKAGPVFSPAGGEALFLTPQSFNGQAVWLCPL